MQKEKKEEENKKRSKNKPTSEHAEEAHSEAEKDINEDTTMVIPSDEDDFLDEGELARKEGHP